jgi:signal transduction histidine kinase
MQAMGELAAGLAHEIRNPLNAIGTIIQQLRTDFKPTEHLQDYEQLTDIVYGEVRRINEAVQSFLRTVRPEPLRAELFELQELISFVKKEYEAMFSVKGVRLSVNYAWKGDVQWDRRQMQQVMMNLVQNAVDASGSDGEIDISISQPDPEMVEMVVSDNGSGMSPETLRRIFSLYFTTKAEGTGIGLSMVQRIVEDHGGTIVVQSEKNAGTIFTIRLPQWYTKRSEA